MEMEIEMAYVENSELVGVEVEVGVGDNKTPVVIGLESVFGVSCSFSSLRKLLPLPNRLVVCVSCLNRLVTILVVISISVAIVIIVIVIIAVFALLCCVV